jgi:enoyl-CoA hydratase
VSRAVHTEWPVTPAGGRYGVVTVEQPDRLNIVGSALLAELRTAIEGCAAEPGLRALVLRGAGERAFIGGANMREMAGFDPVAARAFITRLHDCCATLRAVPVPVIARLRGFALGAGLEIAAACDLRIAADDARFGMPEVRVGIPSVIEAALLPMLIGWGRTRWLLMTGDIIGAAQAERWGLVERVVPAAALDDAVAEVVATIESAGPAALATQKRLIRQWEDMPTTRAIQAGIDAFADAFRTDEPRRMMTAFLNRKEATPR